MKSTSLSNSKLDVENSEKADLNKKLERLEQGVKEGASTNKGLISKFRSCEFKLKSCDRNFDAALENLFQVQTKKSL